VKTIEIAEGKNRATELFWNRFVVKDPLHWRAA
jgi:hypothetical protein